MKKINIVTRTYALDDEWLVDIMDNKEEDIFYAWIYHKDYCVKDMMYGWPKHQPTGLVTDLKTFKEMVLCGWEDYAESYREEYMDEDICCPVCGSHDVELIAN
jgi:hypothetical protein